MDGTVSEKDTRKSWLNNKEANHLLKMSLSKKQRHSERKRWQARCCCQKSAGPDSKQKGQNRAGHPELRQVAVAGALQVLDGLLHPNREDEELTTNLCSNRL